MTQQIAQRSRTSTHVDRPRRYAAEMANAVERSLQLAHVAAQLLCQKLEDILRQRRLAVCRFGAEDVQPRLHVRRRQAPDGAAEQTIHQFWREVVGQPRVAIAASTSWRPSAKRASACRKLDVRGAFSGQKVNVVNQERIALPEEFAEGRQFAEAQSLHETVRKVLAGDVADAIAGQRAAAVDAFEQMRPRYTRADGTVNG